MYRPSKFIENDESLLHQLISDHSFAVIVTVENGGPIANHFPILIKQEGVRSTLIGHMARANPQWKSFESGKEILVIFQGPHTYVSPSWYGPGVQVPTWNYAAVHVYGVPKILSHEETYQVLEDMVQKYESRFQNPWKLDLPEKDKQQMLNAIVGFKIPITRMEGKLKLNQNRTDEDRESVMNTLSKSSEPMDRAVGELMRTAHSSSIQ